MAVTTTSRIPTEIKLRTFKGAPPAKPPAKSGKKGGKS